MDEELKELFKLLLVEQTATVKSIGALAVTVDKYVASAEARMTRLEENLDSLIRAITREHTNGKAH